MADIRYVAPRSLDEAVGAYAAAGSAARILAGGTDLLVQMRSGVVKPGVIVDIKKTWVGDANLDGLFDNIDMVSIYAYKQYEDDKPQNSGWAQGDFDGDQEFTAADVTQAMQSGAFEKGPRKN